MKTVIKPLLVIGLSFCISLNLFADADSDIAQLLKGATVIAQDENNTYIGRLCNKYDSESIFNKYGKYGSEYSSTSIWNKYSIFGSPFSAYSAFNKLTKTPPVIIKNGKIIAYITVNKLIQGGISPYYLKEIADNF
jgi:hypothetical protein